MDKMRILFSLGLLLSATVPAGAHHAFAAEFDATKPVKLKGVVTEMEWINPHAWIHMDVTDDKGGVSSWMIECGTPNTLLRRGMNKSSVKAGMEIMVDGYLAKDGTNKANGRDVTFLDGKKLFLGPPNSEPEGADKK